MILLDNPSRHASFYFAAEEYIMRSLKPCEPALMLWSTVPTVMLGANQVAAAECDLAYAKDAGIEIVRRPSGGGAIFTDTGTLQLTVVLPYESGYDVGAFTRDWLAAPLAAALNRYGIDATPEGRNDVTIDGKKISGMAQHVRNGYICSHSSILFDTDLEQLARALTADREKFETKAVASVRARVTNIAEHIPPAAPPLSTLSSGEPAPTLAAFRETLVETLFTSRQQSASPAPPCHCEGVQPPKQSTRLRQQTPCQSARRPFTPTELAAITATQSGRYENDEWTYGHEPAFTYRNKKRFPGGTLEALLDVKGGVIQTAKIHGDFLALRPVTELETALKNIPHRKDALSEALRPLDLKPILGSLTAQDLLETLL